MITSDVSKQEELRYLASLIALKKEDNETTSKTINKPHSLNDTNIIERMDHHGVTMLALEYGQLSSNIAEKLGPRKALMVASSMLKTRALKTLFKHLNEKNLQTLILFKGSALAQTYYPAPWLRPCTDSDILIAKSDRLKYDSILNQLKFKKLLSIEGELVSYQSTYVGKLTQQSSLILDLHWRINNRQTLAKTYSVNELIDRGETIENLDHSVIMPSAIDCILLSCVHRLGHHANDERLIWLYDIHVLANTLEETDWQKLCLLCKDKQIAAITLDALLICEDLFDTPIPTDSKQTLKVLANRNEASKLVLNRSASELHLFIQDLKSLDSFSLKLKLLKENLLPCADYIRESMNTNSLLKGHLKRAFRGIKRITKRP